MTENESLGIAWWNHITESQRAKWLEIAKSAIPAEAWAAFQSQKSFDDLTAEVTTVQVFERS